MTDSTQSSWRLLPGPAAFLDSVEQDLRDGRNVIVAAPAGALPDLREALADRVVRNDYWCWRPVEFAEEDLSGSDPCEVIARRFVWSGGDAFPVTPELLAEARILQGCVVCIEGIPPAAWPRWREFLGEYEHARRNSGGRDGPLFCAMVRGIQEGDLPRAAVALAVRAWRGVVTSLDVWLHVSRRLPPSAAEDLFRRQLACSVCAALAGPDLVLADFLVMQGLSRVLKPVSLLEAWAVRCGWTAEGARQPSWSSGMCDEFEGKVFVHSAVLALRGQYEELDRRLWRGQVGVVFPFLEGWRNALVEVLRHSLVLPFETPFGTITDARDLEIGHLLLMARRGGIDWGTLDLLERLSRMRHALAHMEPAEADDLLAPGLRDGPERWLLSRSAQDLVVRSA